MRIRQAVAGTHAGARDVNEDAVLRLSNVPAYVIADGMGGAGVGDVAAAMALDVVKRHAPLLREQNLAIARKRSTENRLALGRLMDGLFNAANREIADKALHQSRPAMASTLLLASVVRNFAYIAHVGDSRAYLLRNGSMSRLTEDHSVAELRFRRGKMSQEEYDQSPERQVLYQVLGAGVDVDVDLAEVRLDGGDVLLLCSDGLVRALDEGKITGTVHPDDLTDSLRRLLSAAIEAGAPDNVSAVLLGMESEEGDEPIEVVTDVLREVFLFRQMTTQELLVVAPYLEEVVLEKGVTVVSEGDPADSFYVVVSGRLRVTRGKTRLVDVRAGGHFGELALARPIARSATVRTLSQTRMFSLTRQRFHELLTAKPKLGAKLAVSLLDAVGERLRELTQRLEAVERAARGELK